MFTKITGLIKFAFKCLSWLIVLATAIVFATGVVGGILYLWEQVTELTPYQLLGG